MVLYKLGFWSSTHMDTLPKMRRKYDYPFLGPLLLYLDDNITYEIGMKQAGKMENLELAIYQVTSHGKIPLYTGNSVKEWGDDYQFFLWDEGERLSLRLNKCLRITFPNNTYVKINGKGEVYSSNGHGECTRVAQPRENGTRELTDRLIPREIIDPPGGDNPSESPSRGPPLSKRFKHLEFD